MRSALKTTQCTLTMVVPKSIDSGVPGEVATTTAELVGREDGLVIGMGN
jgi:hypothetical protein